MTKRHRSFTTRDEPESTDDVTFDIDKETFTCIPEIAGSTILEFMSANDRGNAAIAGALLPFFQDVMDEEEHTRFRVYIDNPKNKVDMEMLAEIVGYLVEEYTERPTERSESSGSGA